VSQFKLCVVQTVLTAIHDRFELVGHRWFVQEHDVDIGVRRQFTTSRPADSHNRGMAFELLRDGRRNDRQRLQPLLDDEGSHAVGEHRRGLPTARTVRKLLAGTLANLGNASTQNFQMVRNSRRGRRGHRSLDEVRDIERRTIDD